MAERRMFAKTIVDSDAFLEMPQSAQLLYFHLAMRADDDGFINKPKSIMRSVGAKDDDMKILLAKKFVIRFPEGIVVIKHWRIHNYIQKDRYHETKYTKLKNSLGTDENGAYSESIMPEICEKSEDVSNLYPECIQVVSKMDTQVRLGKSKDSIEKDILSSKPTETPYEAIINYLNLKARTSFKPYTAKTKTCIHARFAEGFKENDFYAVIDDKVADWGGDPKMSAYLRPETLFGTKMEGYLQKAMKGKKSTPVSDDKAVKDSMYEIFKRHNDLYNDSPNWSMAGEYPEEFNEEQKDWLIKHGHLRS